MLHQRTRNVRVYVNQTKNFRGTLIDSPNGYSKNTSLLTRFQKNHLR